MKHKIKKMRDPNWNHPLMRKGGMHEKTNKAKRRKEKVNLLASY
jgi:hypothetical protein